MEKPILDKKSLQKFGVMMGAAFFVVAMFILAKHRHNPIPIVVISAAFFVIALFTPNLLKPVYIIWMKFAFVLGWINTRLLLIAIFYLIFMPIGLTMRLFRIDLLDRKIEKNKKSYWKEKIKQEFNPLSYERQF